MSAPTNPSDVAYWLYLCSNPRITDYSFQAAAALETMPAADVVRLRPTLNQLYAKLLDWSTGTDALYPMSNWQPHRLCLMAALAAKVKSTTWANQVLGLVGQWPKVSDCIDSCGWNSQDFHHRDAISYVVYGWWALAQACVYLQRVLPLTTPSLRPLFREFVSQMDKYKTGRLGVHIEFLKSKIASDVQKPLYGKPYPLDYNTNFDRWYRLVR